MPAVFIYLVYVAMAEETMEKEMGLLALPTGLPTIDNIDKKIEMTKSKM